MELKDLPEVMVVERLAYPYPWTEKVMQNCLQAKHYHGWVLEINHAIKGYLFLSVMVDEMHILNLCVHPELQGQGWGRNLLNRAFQLAGSLYKANMCFLEVRPSNAAALALYQSVGFNEIGLRKNYYPADQGREDALVMARSIIP
ncbi:MAG: ribosomal-protein-alanine N-acetyltransferase [Proteobacteria bacterium]|nr:MAG: ribosomal-protein-alanine N-acetyltransferase [Pseudomonadota bacterium]